MVTLVKKHWLVCEAPMEVSKGYFLARIKNIGFS